MTIFKRLVSIFAFSVLAACGGGGGDPGTPPFVSGPSTPSAADLVLTLSASSVANNGTETIVATALAIDANRNTVAGVPLTISVNSGVATASGSVTDDAGAVTATIGIGSDRTNRTITVTAKSGSLTKTASLLVVDSVGGGGTAPSELLLTLSATSIANDGSQTVTATATALDAKRNVLPGVAVSVSVDDVAGGATIQPSGTTTGTNGALTAVIGIGAVRTNRTIMVRASSGALSQATPLAVVDNPAPVTPSAASLILTLSASTLDNGGTSTIVATATALDSKRNTLPAIPITFSVTSNAVATVSSPVTNASGVVTATIGIGADRTSRVVTVTATSGSAPPQSASFSVKGAKLTASFAPSVIAGTANQIEYKLVDTNGIAMAGQSISVTSPALPTSSGTTDLNGKFIYSYSAPASATSLEIVASAAGDSLPSTVTVLAAGNVDPAVGPIQSASLTPSPSVISVNAVGSTTNPVELRALFLGANNQPIKNVRVVFDLGGNANSTDGKVSQLGTYAYSDSTGVARGTFTPGQISSPTNGITVRACYSTIDFTPPTNNGPCPVSSVSNTVTVTSEALSVNIRTNNLVDPTGGGGLTYIKQFVVMVVDAAGQAKQDVLITPSIDLPAYYKGVYQWNGTVWKQHMSLATTESYSYNSATPAWVQGALTSQPSCPNEDVNRNGVREASAYDSTTAAPTLAARQEDLNWNGDLDPRKADVAVKMVGSSKTDANGLAIVQIEYGKNLASWVDFVITVTASGISGTEARARYSGLFYGVGNLPGLAADVTTETVPPPFAISPYGRGSFSRPIDPILADMPTGVCTDTK